MVDYVGCHGLLFYEKLQICLTLFQKFRLLEYVFSKNILHAKFCQCMHHQVSELSDRHVLIETTLIRRKLNKVKTITNLQNTRYCRPIYLQHVQIKAY